MNPFTLACACVPRMAGVIAVSCALPLKSVFLESIE